MAVTGLAGQNGVQPATATPKRSRARLYVLLIISLALVVGAFIYLANYQPLYSPGTTSAQRTGYVQWPASQPGVSSARSYQLEAISGLGPSNGGVTFESPKPGFQFGFANLVLSNGFIPVKVIDVQASLGEKGVSDSVRYRVAQQTPVMVTGTVNTSAGPTPEVVPLAPFAISQNSKMVSPVGVQFIVPLCANQLRNYTKNTVLEARSFYVTYKYLWFTHKVLIGVPPYIAIVAPYDCGTPAK